MAKTIAHTLRLGLAFSVFALAVTALPGWAQLADVIWSESLSLNTSLGQDYNVGEQPAVPEPQSGSLSGAGYTLNGSISFSSPGPPNTTASIDASYQSGLTYLMGSAYSRIDFSFRVVQTVTPPVAVSTVLVNVHAQGTAETSGNLSLYPNANSTFNLSTPTGPLVSWGASASSHAPASPQTSDSFDESQQFELAPDVVVSGDMTASAGVVAEILQGNTSASGSAMVDPVIEVADALIPGTAVNYRDYFTVEFATGYDALGSVPVQNTTWGKIKTLYGN